MKCAPLILLCAVFLVLSAPSHADMRVLGLFKGAALLEMDGEQKLLKVGQQWQGITLLEANSRQARARMGDEDITLTVSTHITTHFAEPVGREVIIRKNSHRQYITTALINGRSAEVLVDTGANVIAMNAVTADRLGVDYRKGTPTRVSTASGIVAAHTVMLDSVDVGGIEVNRVQASIIEGSFPENVLLGTSYLQHVEMSEKDGILLLKNKY